MWCILYGTSFTLDKGGNSYQPCETSSEVHLPEQVEQRPGNGPTPYILYNFQTVSGFVSLTCPG